MLLNQAQERWKSAAATAQFPRGLPGKSLRMDELAVDLDLSLVDVHLPNLELRKEDITARPVDPCSFDLVTARAVLHHLPTPRRRSRILLQACGLEAPSS